jgi:hypothetical protein
LAGCFIMACHQRVKIDVAGQAAGHSPAPGDHDPVSALCTTQQQRRQWILRA